MGGIDNQKLAYVFERIGSGKVFRSYTMLQ